MTEIAADRLCFKLESICTFTIVVDQMSRQSFACSRNNISSINRFCICIEKAIKVNDRIEGRTLYRYNPIYFKSNKLLFRSLQSAQAQDSFVQFISPSTITERTQAAFLLGSYLILKVLHIAHARDPQT